MPERLGGRLTLLRREAGYRLLFFGALGSGVGTYLAAITMTVQVYDQTGSGTWVAALLVADFLPIVVIGLALGPLIDRLPRKRLMIAADLTRCAVFVALPFVGGPTAIVALAAVSGIATGFFRPAVYAGLPNLVDDDDLTEANSLLAAAENLAWVVGPLAAGAMLALAGPSLPYAVNAVTFLVSAALIFRIPARGLQSEESLSRGHWRDVADGFRLVLGEQRLRTVLVVWNIVIVANAGINVGEIVVAKDVLDGGDLGYAAIVAATGVGLTIGSLLITVVLGSVGLRRAYVSAIVLMSLGWALAAGAPTIWLAALAAAVATVGNGAAIVCNQLLIQRGAPDALRGRAIAVLMSTTYATLAIAMVLSGVVTNVAGGRTVWAAAAAIYGLGAVAAFVMTRSLRAGVDAAPTDAGLPSVEVDVAPENVASTV